MQIYFKNTQKDLKISASSVKELVISLLQKLGSQCHEISIHLVTTKKISKLHLDFFQDPTTTDCITFPIDADSNDPYIVLGEVFVCPKTALDFAAKRNKDVYEESTLYIVHGILHLLGYDDIDPKDRKLMRKKERECMKFIHEHNLLLKK